MEVGLLQQTGEQLDGSSHAVRGHVRTLVRGADVFDQRMKDGFQNIGIVRVEQIEQEGDLTLLQHIALGGEQARARGRADLVGREECFDEVLQLSSIEREMSRNGLEMFPQKGRSIEQCEKSKQVRRRGTSRPIEEVNDDVENGRVRGQAQHGRVGLKLGQDDGRE